MRYLLLIITILISPHAVASLEKELGDFFDAFSDVNNISGPDAYKGQSAGYYTGGRVFARTQTRQMQPVSVHLPNYNAGCGGIDMYTGGFAFVNSDELVRMLRNIGNNAGSLAFAIGLKTYMPMLSNQMEYLNKLAQDVNQFNINSCETAAMGLGMIAPQTHATQDVLCKQGVSDGKIGSAFEKRMACNKALQDPNSEQSGISKKDIKEITNANITWNALKANGMFSKNNEFAEFLMSLSGTVIIREGKIESKPSLIEQSNLLAALLRGGQGSVYKCVEYEHCLNPSNGTIQISSDKGLSSMVEKLLLDMTTQSELDLPLTDAQKAFLNSTSIPVYKILKVNSAYAPATKFWDISHYADLIAYDLMFQFLSDSLREVESLAYSQKGSGEITSEVFDSMQKARRIVDSKRARAAAKANEFLNLIDHQKKNEQTVAGQVADKMKSALGMNQ
jgi:conjugative transfer pilus assembly protein TraH